MSEDPRTGSGRRRLLIGVGLLGVLLSAVAVLLLLQQGRRDAEQAQSAQLARVAERIGTAISGPVGQLDSLAPLYGRLGRELRPGETRDALSTLLDQPAATGAVVVEVIGARDRAAIERRVGGRLIEVDARGRNAPAPRRARYAIVIDQVTRPDTTYAPLNVLEAPGRREAIGRVEATGRPAVTAATVSIRDRSPSVIVYAPVRGSRTPAGRLLAVGLSSEVLLKGIRGAGAPTTIQDAGVALDGQERELAHPMRRLVRVLGRDWTVSVGRRPVAIAMPLVAGLSGLLTTLLGVLGLRLLLRRSRRARVLLARTDAELERAMEAAEAARRRSRFLAENSTDMLCLSGMTGEWHFVSPASQRLLGYSAAELIGRAPHELCHPDELESLLSLQAGLVRPGDQRTLTHRLRRRDGSYRWVELHAHATETGELQSSYRDVTVRRDSEEALRSAEARFRAVFAAAPLGMGLLALDAEVLQVNAAFEALTGLAAEGLEGRRLDELLHPADARIHRQTRAGLVQGDLVSHTAELRVRHSEGAMTWCEVHSALLFDDRGAPEHLLVQLQDISSRRRYEQQLQHLAERDPLTGLRNRRTFERAVTEQLQRTRRSGPQGALLVIDLDHFKVVNDTHGHAAGDRLLVAAAHSLGERLRSSDLLARLGGDEFAVLLPFGGREEAEATAAAVLASIAGQAGVTPAGSPRPITASVGIALIDAPDLTAEELMIRADLSLYDAKEAGRGQFRLHDAPAESDRIPMAHRITWADRIRDALAHDAFELHAQPIVSLDGDPGEHYELLVRMRSPTGELIPPASFIYVAERFGLVQRIDRWVAGQAIELLAHARAHGRELTLDVNVSGRSVGDLELLTVIREGLQRTGVDPASLVFEVTETAAVADIPRARHFADELGRLGCRFALDDFGAGFGSFYYLKHLPFDFVKLDGEFVRGCAHTVTDQLIVRAVVEIARGLGKQTVAECVEDEETVAYLRGAGVDHAQGYHLGRPVPVSDLLRRFSRR